MPHASVYAINDQFDKILLLIKNLDINRLKNMVELQTVQLALKGLLSFYKHMRFSVSLYLLIKKKVKLININTYYNEN